MGCVVREGFPEDMPLHRALKAGKREPDGCSEECPGKRNCPGPGSQRGAEPGVFGGTETRPRLLVRGEGKCDTNQAWRGHGGQGPGQAGPCGCGDEFAFPSRSE